MSNQPFPFTRAELQTHFATLYPDSFVLHDAAAFWLQRVGNADQLAILARPDNPLLNRFRGEHSAFQAGYVVKLCPTDHANARALRAALPWLSPAPIGLDTSAGLGDRLGLATPGHVRAMRTVGGDASTRGATPMPTDSSVPRADASNIVPIFAQQSIREMQRTGRTPDDVMRDATWGAFQAGWRSKLGADADHLKVPADIEVCVAAGFTFYTIDPGAYVDGDAEHASPASVESKVAALPWKELESTPTDLERNLVGQTIRLENQDIELDQAALLKAAAKYGRAVAHVVTMYRHLASKDTPFELEVSVDETETPTTHAEHIYIASELKRLGVKWISLALRYLGRFEKGVDYIGDIAAFEKDFAIHAEIARCFGPYKLSIHSGSDKFSIYPAAMRETRGLVHLKTAGTSYLEALRTIAALDAAFFRALYTLARECYETDRASYHVSAELARAPLPQDVHDTDLPALLNQFDARQILHVTFGSVLTARDANGRLRFRDRLMELLRANPEAYAANLEAHLVRHLRPFGKKA